LESIYVNLGQLAFREAIGAVPAKSRFVFGRVALEKLAVLFRGEIIKRAVMAGGEFRLSLHRLVVGEKRDGIVTLDGDARFVEVKKGFALGEGREGQPQSDEEQ